MTIFCKQLMRSAVCACALLCGATVEAANVERIFRAPRLTRGNTNIFPVQPIDAAAWLTHPDFAHEGAEVAAPRLVRFRCAFTSDGAPLVFDVTADERFYLTLDGQFVARGPHRGSVDNWMYQSYRVPLAAGQHVMEAVVWKLGKAAPFAQLSHRLGFCLKAEGAYDAALTTGRGAWTCGALEGVLRPRGKGAAAGWFATGDTFELTGTGVLDAQPATWRTPAVVRDAFLKGSVYGHRRPGWMLYPSQLPDQTEDRVRPGRFVMGGEMTFPFTVPAGGKRHIRWDLDRYICAYPEAVVSGGKGGKMSWLWAESLCAPSKDPRDKKWYKGNRSAWKGKGFGGFGDTFVFDGRARAVFQPPWFRCGRWCELVIEAGAEPVTVEDLSLVESRYPLACETAFTSPDDPALADVQRIAVRTMQMCSHEMLFDCPFYEQQMYPGDTRVQLNVLSSMTSDDALIRRAIEIYDLNRRDDGSVPFNFPTRDTQEGAAYTLCYLGMYPDYVMYHTDRAWLRARLPGMRGTLSGFELYERADGLVENLPGWSFMDWVPRPGWEGGWAPGSRGGGANAELNLFYLAALQGAAQVEDAMGNAHLAAHWREKAARLKPAIAAAFFDAARGLFASDAAHTVFSEHAQCLALLTDVFEGERAQALFDRLVATPDLCPTSVYFSYYLFEAYFKFRRPDLFLKRLDLWKGYVKLGASTCLEEPEYPGRDSRSDCHAWGAHPLWFLRTGVAGIRSDAPFFARVKVVPQPGPLTSLRASYPPPSGQPLAVDLAFAGGRARGTVTTPVTGTFTFGGETIELVPGLNRIGPEKTASMVVPMFGGRLVAEGAKTKVEPQVASANWWFHGGYEGDEPDADGVYRFKLKPDDNQPIVEATLKLRAIDGGVHADYTFTPTADARLNALSVKTSFDYADWRALSVDGRAVAFPTDRKTVGFFSGDAQEVALMAVKGRTVVFRFAAPTRVQLQSNRAWGSENFTLSLPVPGQSLYKGGVALAVSFDLVGAGDFDPKAGRPVVVSDLPGWVPIEMSPWVKEGSALDFTSVRKTEAPAGRHGRVVARGGHFEFENLPGVPQRFYGVNVCNTANIPPQGKVGPMVEAIMRTGYNAIRFHHHDGHLVDKDDPAALKPDEDALRRFDALVAACVKSGVYLTTDLYVSRTPTWRSVGIDRDGKMGMWDFKRLVVIHKGTWENYKAFVRLFLGHRNAFTGRTLAEEPALIGLSLVNENPLDVALPQVYAQLPGWKEAWEKWLAEQKKEKPEVYGDIPASFPGGYVENRHGAAFLVFLQDVERHFAKSVRAFLRDELGCKALLTNMNCSGTDSSQVVRHDAYDYTDTHFYVDHPHFLGPAWSIPSMSASVNTFRLPTAGAQPCAGLRFFDRPFTITEFNYCGPSPIRSFGGFATGAEAALQDWSGLWRFAWSHSDWYGFISPESGGVAAFDVVNDPIQRIGERVGIALFLRGDVKPLTAEWRLGFDRNRFRTLDPSLATDVHREETARVGWTAKYGMDLDGVTPAELPPPPETGREVSVDTTKGTFRVATDRTAGGYCEEGTLEAGILRAAVSGSPATVYAISLDDTPLRAAPRILVAHLTDAQRAETKFADPAMKVLLDWGKANQMLMRPGRAEVSLSLENPAAYAVWSLAIDGERRTKLPTRVENGRLAFTADVASDPRSATCVYEIVRETD